MYGLTMSILGCTFAGLLYYGIGADANSTRQAATSYHRPRVVHRDEAVFAAAAPVRTRAPQYVGNAIVAAAVTEPSAPTTGAAPTSQPVPAVSASTAEPGIEMVSVEDDIRFVPTTRPATPTPQKPPESNEKNVDTGKPVHEWQRLTDDWWGARPWLDDHGISIQASLTIDWSSAMAGGVDGGHSTAFRDLLNANVTVDTERLLNLKGGTLFVNFQQQAGRNGAEIAGDLQGISNIDSPDDRAQLAEVWYQQAAFDDRLKVKAGKIDVGADFGHAPDADEFINGAFGAQPTILGFPTYPDPSTGGSAFFKPTEHTSIGVGIFDGSSVGGHPTGNVGPAGLWSDSGIFSIVEGAFDWKTKSGLEGTLSAGFWHHSGDFERFDGSKESGTSGAYVMVDQKLWRENPADEKDDQGVGLFAKYGHADGEVSAIDNHVAAGVAWTGPVPTRDDDVLGFGITFAGISDDAGLSENNETIYELFYRLRLNAWFSIKPDLQYIHGAADGGDENTLVGTIRMVIDF